MRSYFSGNSIDYNNDAISIPSPTEKMAQSHFLNIVGMELSYYGADSADNTFKVDGIVFKVLEDPNDGYRSMLGTIDYTDESTSIFFRSPIASVRIETYDSGTDSNDPDHPDNRNEDDDIYGINEGYAFVDVDDGHIWLQFGTDNYDDYYPMFIFRHTPRVK